MKRDQRLRRRSDFQRAYRQGRVHGNQLLVLRILPNGGPVTRFGFVVGKAVGGAVVRNRVRRRLREIARMFACRPGLDIVINARRITAEAQFGQLREAMGTLLERGRALQPAPPPSTEEQA